MRTIPFTVSILLSLILVTSIYTASPSVADAWNSEYILEPTWTDLTNGNIRDVFINYNNSVAVVTTANKIFVYDEGGTSLWNASPGLIKYVIGWGPNNLFGVIVSDGNEKVVAYDAHGDIDFTVGWGDDLWEFRALAWGNNALVVVAEYLQWVEIPEDNGYTLRSLWNTTLEIYNLTGGLVGITTLNTSESSYYSVYDLETKGDLIAIAATDGVHIYNTTGHPIYQYIPIPGHVIKDAFLGWVDPETLVAYLSEYIDGAYTHKVYIIDLQSNTTHYFDVGQSADDFSVDSSGLIALMDIYKVDVYDLSGNLLWSLSGANKRFYDIEWSGDGRLGVSWAGEKLYEVEAGVTESYKAVRVSIYNRYGTLLWEEVDWYLRWGNNTFATWHDDKLTLYKSNYIKAWEKSFYDNVYKVSWSNGLLCVAPDWVKSPTGGETFYIYNLSGYLMPIPDYNLRRFVDAFLTDNYLVVTGYKRQTSRLLLYDLNYTLLMNKSYYYSGNVYIPKATIINNDILVVGNVYSNASAYLEYYNISSGSLIKSLYLGRYIWVKSVKRVGGNWIVYETNASIGLVNDNYEIVFERSLKPWYDPNDIDLIGGDRIAVLIDGDLMIYSLDGDSLWNYTYHIDYISGSNRGLLAAADYKKLIIFNSNGDVLWKKWFEHKITFLKWFGEYLATGIENGTLYLFRLDGSIEYVMLTTSAINTMAWSADDYIAVGGSGGVYVYKYVTRPRKLIINLPDRFFYAYVNGMKYYGPHIELELPPGTYLIETPRMVEHGYIRYGFQGWEDGITTPSRIINLTQDTVLNATYTETQYYINVYSKYGSVTGEGWYNKGEWASISISPTSIDFGNDTRVLFDGWSTGDKSSSINIIVDKPMNITAYWIIQYYVSITSKYGDVSGEGWYNKGETASISVSPTNIDLGNDTRVIFKEWSTGSTDPSINILVNEPIRITAHWTIQYYISVTSRYGDVSGEGWYDRGSTASISITPSEIDFGNKTRLVFIGWSTGEASPTFTVKVNGPMSIEARWDIQYYVSVSTDYAEASGEGWYDKGGIATISISQTEASSNGKQYKFIGWYIEQEEVSKDAQFTLTVNKPLTIHAKWVEVTPSGFNYWLLLIILLIILAAIAYYLYRRRKRKQS